MSIKTEEIIPGTVVITSKPDHPLRFPGDHLFVMGEDAQIEDTMTMLPYGVALTIVSAPRHVPGVGAQIVDVENFGGVKYSTFLSYLKPRVRLAYHD